MSIERDVDFVSLLELIEATARPIVVADEEVDAYLPAHTSDDETILLMSRSPLRQLFKESRAAVKLLKYLSNSDASDLPKWFDRSAINIPIQDEAARNNGLSELKVRARWEWDHKTAAIQPTFSSQRWGGGTSPTVAGTGLCHPGQGLPRVRLIGFDRPELVRFLCKFGIPRVWRDDVSNEKDTSISSCKAAETERLVGEQADEFPGGLVGERGPTPVGRPHLWFSGHLGPALNSAYTKSDVPHDANAMWSALVALAKMENPPHHLTGYAENEVKYCDISGEISCLSREMLGKRYRYALRKLETTKKDQK
ncbi:hypothetical protein PAN31117_04641 [Pandoraea anapnoica]|uniref:Uncharacterized protein n=1 Tax=Pandoraea anapnoica TaxID=2508301 RepID=A0A5E5AJA7_9BURK|nr:MULTISPECIES: hypothetical protein [Pandoraea]VVE42589.1 hypothetical protein PIN31009_04197 [Pandoraea iniqua]VVE73176.1 hypothetical protein PAN31117_04641 [Pandoraea anapnoica]